MTAGRYLYVDVGAARIQQYVGRTRRLKGQRGASSWLSWATAREQVEHLLGELPDDPALAGHAAARSVEPNPEAGEADGIISVRIPEQDARDGTARAMATALAGRLRSVLPSLEIGGLWGAGPTYLEAYRDYMKPHRDDPPLVFLPPTAGFPPLESCQECRADPVAEEIRIHEETRRVCLDCDARYADRYRRWGLARQHVRLPAYREEASLARELGRHPVAGTAQDFGDLAALGRGDTGRNHVATVYVDGNKVGALFDLIAGHGDPGLKERVSGAISKATREALLEAARAVLGESPDEPLPVIPHIVGGDDLVVTVVADRAWPFTVRYLEAFQARVRDIPGLRDVPGAWPPTASAGLVFAHAKFPFRQAVELAGEQLRAAKQKYQGDDPAVAWLDVTRDGARPPGHRSPWTLAQLLDRASALSALRAQVEPSGRAVLERLIDPEQPAVSLARVREHARRLDRAPVVEPFLTGPEPGLSSGQLAGALSIVRWWR